MTDPEPTIDTPKRAPEPPSSIPWPPLLLVIVTAAAIALATLAPISWPGLDDLPARIVGLSIGAGGLALLVYSASTLMRARTTILPHKPTDNLVTTGPYARFRNPIYIADAMMLLGAAELFKNIWFVVGAAAFVILVTWLAILPEERHLEARFGEAYRAYKSRSRRWL